MSSYHKRKARYHYAQGRKHWAKAKSGNRDLLICIVVAILLVAVFG